MKTYYERMNTAIEKLAEIRKVRARKRTARLIAAVAVLTLVLFFPLNVEPPNVRAYSDSPYYDLIKEIDRAKGGKPGYKNLFTAITQEIAALKKTETDNPSTETPDVPPVVTNPEDDNDLYVNLNYADDSIPGLTDGEVVLQTEDYSHSF